MRNSARNFLSQCTCNGACNPSVGGFDIGLQNVLRSVWRHPDKNGGLHAGLILSQPVGCALHTANLFNKREDFSSGGAYK